MMSLRSSSLHGFRRVPSVSRSFKDRSKSTSPIVAAARGRKKASSDGNNKSFDKIEAMMKLSEEINAEYGKGTMSRLTDQPLDVPKFSTGLLSLDLILGGGIPKGRIVEIFGPEATGKTTLAVQLLAEMQKPDNIVQFIDVENAFNPNYAANLGINPERLIMTSPSSGGEAFDIMLKVIRNRIISGICVDSVAALTPVEELTASIEDSQMALQARMMSKGVRNINQSNKHVGEDDSCTVIFINQIRMKIGTAMFQNPEDRPGGKALRFYSSVVLELRRGKAILGADGEKIGHKLIVKNPKNKISVPHKEVVLDLFYGEGLCKMGSLLDAALMLDVVETRGSYYSYGGERLAQGRSNVVDRLKQEPELAAKITEATWLAYEEAIAAKKANTIVAPVQEPDDDADKDIVDEEESDDESGPSHGIVTLDSEAGRKSAEADA